MIYPRVMFRIKSPFLFSNALGSTDVKNKINVFLNSVPSDDVDDTLDVFNNIIETACSLSLRKKARPVKKKIIRRKNWFDADLQSIQKELHRKGVSYSRHPDDPIVRGSFL